MGSKLSVMQQGKPPSGQGIGIPQMMFATRCHQAQTLKPLALVSIQIRLEMREPETFF